MSLPLSVVAFLRSFYVISAASILFGRLIPPFRTRFLDYGARQPQHATNVVQKGRLTELLDYVATIRVPHSTFWHFYFLSCGCTAFWTSHISNGGRILHIFSQDVPPPANRRPTSPARIGLCLFMLWVQAIRRLWECTSFAVNKPSTSSMWIGHYLIGMAFYFVTNIAIFIEHVHVLLKLDSFTNIVFKIDRGPSLLEASAFLAFIIASKKQHDYHLYLSSLEKYTLPTMGAFQVVIAPHYTAECVIYLSLAILSSSTNQQINLTMLCALAFVATNLGITADGTKKWMLTKFPDHHREIEKRWKMIPGVF